MISINILFPVLNEEDRLENGIEETLNYIKNLDDAHFTLTIVDNGSTDATEKIALALASKHNAVQYLRIKTRGVGAAFRAGVAANTCDIVGYMDVDLSTDIRHLEEVVHHFSHTPDLYMVNGSRLSKDADMNGRKWYRNLSSYGLKWLLKVTLSMKASDAICGFKFYRAADLPDAMGETSNENGWFYIIELLIRSERKRLKIVEIPVRWEDDHRTTVHFFKLMQNYITQISRLYFLLNREKKH
jgi:glycosyltransferase involved in cell wall biosynthesis